MKEMDDNEFKALVSLLDDEDEEIVQNIEDRIMSLGSPVIPFLEEEWEKNFNPIVQRRIEDLIHVLQYEELQQKLVMWRDSKDQDLIEGIWLLTTYQYPDYELTTLRQDLEQIYYEAWLEFKPEVHPYDKVKILNSVLFSKLKFTGNTKNFHSPANSMINNVLESKRGNPISLCIIYMLVAQKLKMPVWGVNLPNLFILTYKDDDQQFYINVFNKGLIFLKEDIDNYLQHLHLNQDEIYYEPCTNLEIIQRAMRNLMVAYEKVGDHEKVEEVKVLLKSIS
jgi:regulator of sirC expression with transglutaminase-like and TPR domain